MMADIRINLLLGAAAGFAGAFVLQGLRGVSEKLLPGTLPPTRQDPGKYMVERAEEAAIPPPARERVPEAAETIAGMTLGAGYGMTFGALYAGLRGLGPTAERDGTAGLLLDGAILGAGTWAVGYLGWLPALDLTPPVTKQEPEMVASTVIRHMLYGIATVSAYRYLSNSVGSGNRD